MVIGKKAIINLWGNFCPHETTSSITNKKIHKRQCLCACETVIKAVKGNEKEGCWGSNIWGCHCNHSCFVTKGLLILKHSPGFDGWFLFFFFGPVLLCFLSLSSFCPLTHRTVVWSRPYNDHTQVPMLVRHLITIIEVFKNRIEKKLAQSLQAFLLHLLNKSGLKLGEVGVGSFGW